MLDDFQEEADATEFLEELEEEEEDIEVFAPPPRRIYGMTAGQRFIISILLLAVVCILGTFCLIVFERVYPPFL